MACDPNAPEFLRHYARVLLREARARAGTDTRWMIDGALRARREAAKAARPVQGNLFSGLAA